MSKKATLTTVSSGFNSASTINADLAAINDKLDNTVSRDGSTPNTMTADLDLNSNNLLNAGDVAADTLTVGGASFVPNNAVAVPDWEGAWVTSTAYVLNDLVQESGNTYICVEAHTSGTFATDLSATKWELFASKGDSGAGSGDVVAANNLSDLADADTALANLGGGTKGIAIFKDLTSAAVQTELGLVPGTDVQTQDVALQDISDITQVAGDLLYSDGTNIQKLGIGTANQVLAVNSGATAPEWVSSAPQWEKISQTVVSTDATLDFTSLGDTYCMHMLVLEGVVPATDNVTAHIRLSASSTFATSGYGWMSGEDAIGESSSNSESASDSSIKMFPGDVGSASNEHGISGRIYFYDLGNSSKRTRVDGKGSYMTFNGTLAWWDLRVGQRNVTEANDGIRFYFSSGNCESGTATLFGLKN